MHGGLPCFARSSPITLELSVANDSTAMTDDEISSTDTAPDIATQPPLFVLGVGAARLDAGRLAELLDAIAGAANLAIMLLLRDRQLLDEAHLCELLGKQATLLSVPTDGEKVQPGRFYPPPPIPWSRWRKGVSACGHCPTANATTG